MSHPVDSCKWPANQHVFPSPLAGKSGLRIGKKPWPGTGPKNMVVRVRLTG